MQGGCGMPVRKEIEKKNQLTLRRKRDQPFAEIANLVFSWSSSDRSPGGQLITGRPTGLGGRRNHGKLATGPSLLFI